MLSVVALAGALWYCVCVRVGGVGWGGRGLHGGHGRGQLVCCSLAVLRGHAGFCLGMQVGLSARSPKLPPTPAPPHVSPHRPPPLQCFYLTERHRDALRARGVHPWHFEQVGGAAGKWRGSRSAPSMSADGLAVLRVGTHIALACNMQLGGVPSFLRLSHEYCCPDPCASQYGWEGVFVPGGAPHQVRNLRSSIKVGWVGVELACLEQPFLLAGQARVGPKSACAPQPAVPGRRPEDSHRRRKRACLPTPTPAPPHPCLSTHPPNPGCCAHRWRWTL